MGLNKASRIVLPKKENNFRWLGFLNSKLAKYFMKNISNHTIEFGVDDLKSIYVKNVLPSDIEVYVSRIIQKQKQDPRYDYANNEQIEIDRLVYEAYGLTEDDITEVENWYARRYPNLKQTKKAGLKYEVIRKLKRQETYFSYEEIKSLLEKERIEITPSSLKSYVHELVQNKVIFDAGRGWYSTIKKSFELNTKPIQPIIRKIGKEFPLLEFSCWSTEQLNSFTHHLLAKFITYIYTDSDYISNVADFLEKAGFIVFQNPTKQEIEKFFKITDKTVIIRPAISKQPEAFENCSPMEKILVDFLIENKKLSMMDTGEAEDTVKNVLHSGRINISELHSYAKRRGFIVPESINQVQKNINPEMVD